MSLKKGTDVQMRLIEKKTAPTGQSAIWRSGRYHFLLAFIIFLPVFTSYAQTTGKNLDLNDLIGAALQNNPQLKSTYSTLLADSARIPQSGTLPDPVLSLSLMNLPVNSFAFDQEPMTGKQISLMQQFPFPGKLSLREDISAAQAVTSEANYREYKNKLIRDIKTGYYDLFQLDKSIEITEKNRQLMKQFTAIAESRYKVGKGLQQDVLKAQVELSKMIDKLIQLEQKRNVKQAQLNTLASQPVNTLLGKPGEPGFPRFDQDPDSLQALALVNRPMLKGWGSMRQQSRLKVDLAKKDYWPNFGIFLAYTQRDGLQNGAPGYDFLSGGISLSLPIYSGSKQSKKVEETIYNENMIEEKYQQVLNQLSFDLENAYSSLMKNQKLAALFESGIIPQATQSLESALTGYQTDKVDFLTLINNQITLFNYELEYYRVLTDYHKDLADLEYITGVNLSP